MKALILFLICAPISAQDVAKYMLPQPVVDWQYITLNSVQVASSIVDIELTQACMKAHTCREGNPLMPSNRAGVYAVQAGWNALQVWGSYWLKKRGSKYWWVVPTVGIGSHAYGIYGGVQFALPQAPMNLAEHGR